MLNNIDEQSIMAGINLMLDQAAHALEDGNRQTAIDRLKEAEDAIQTLSGAIKLPEICKTQEGNQCDVLRETTG
jgi:hypothetical protein